MQRTFASEDEGARHTGGSAPVGRGVLLRTDGDHSNQWTIVRGPEPAPGWTAARLTAVPDLIPLLQCRPRTATDRQPGRSNRVRG